MLWQESDPKAFYAYDRYGNMWQGDGSLSVGFSGGNNRVDGFAYDAAGNLLNDGNHSYTYDAENRLVTMDGGAASYVYDAEGRRVRKTVAGGAVDFIYDLAGHEIAEMNSSGGWNRGEVYAGGQHLATYSDGATGTTYFVHADWLGTERARSNVSAGPYETCTSLPFGDALSCVGGDASPMHFTGKERDTESGLDNFGARYNSSQLGRFMSPDEIGPGQHPQDPQSWNLYGYVENNPVTLVDHTGQYTCASSVPQQECDNFQTGLNQAQQAANALKDKYGADSDQYQSSQRAIDAYGKEGVDNGVAIAQGNTGSYAAETQVAGAAVAKTADNPTGQNIVVTLNKDLNLLDGDNANVSAMVEAHEGSHVADASDWVSSGFSNDANPSRFQTELGAYHVTENIAQGLGYSSLTMSFLHPTGSTRYSFSVPPKATNGAMNWLMIVNEYPNSNLDAFSRNTRLEGPH